ncbi:MAG: DUF2088 domain-containing protein, partial [Deltaproteobacteria bacterium]|nr:DUF2088 domain-containing protein [Deltaproteobacteria bacterium]
MADYIEEFIFYGDDLKIERFPSDTQLIYANPPLTPLADYENAIKQALDNPIGAEPLEKQLTSSSRVTIAFDDPCLPIPLMRRDMRGLIIEELLRRLDKIGIKKDRIQLICANGLHRKWTMKELSIVLGKKVVAEMGPDRISCHDATDDERLISLGETKEGHEVEINRAVDESDITIYVNVNFSSMNGGWKSILVGLGSWRSIRHHHTPKEWNMKRSIMDPGTSPMHEILREMGELVHSKYNVFQIETVLNNNIWPRPLDRLLRPIHKRNGGSAPGVAMRSMLSLATLAPQVLKRNIRNSLIRADYRLCGIFAGDVTEVHDRTLDILFRQQNVEVKEPVDILVFGVPNLSPYSAQSVLNPILLRSLTMGYLSGLFRGRPLVKEGGVIVACNPGLEKFNLRHHGAYKDFWDNDLEDHYD